MEFNVPKGLMQSGKAMADDALSGDVRALARRIGGVPQSGATPAASAVGSHLPSASVNWRVWVTGYAREVVIAQEWPAVVAAWSHASAGRVDALLDLDRSWGARMGMQPLAEASFRAGQRQLNRLRPLKEVRLIQRYIAAVEAGKAHGWHPMVYGVMLAVFALPLRQGLVHYAEQVLGGLIEGIPDAGRLPETERSRLLEEIGAELPPALGRLLPALQPVVV